MPIRRQRHSADGTTSETAGVIARDIEIAPLDEHLGSAGTIATVERL
jgi:hypothetical protein